MNLDEPIEVPTVTPVEVMNDEQVTRVMALMVAKPMLTGQKIGSVTPPNVDELIRLADWIVTGETEPLYPFFLANGGVQMGPHVVMRPDGYVEINTDLYEPTSEDGHEGDDIPNPFTGPQDLQ